MGIMRLGHVALKVLSIEEAVQHYTQIVGMLETHRDPDGTAYLKCWDEWDKYSIILKPSTEAGVDHVAFKVEHGSDLGELRQRITDDGTAVEDVAAGHLRFCGEAIGFTLPSTHRAYLYAKKESVGRMVGVTNPEPWPDGLKGAGVHWLDHVQLIAEVDPERGINKVAESVDFFCKVLGFRLNEQILVGPDKNFQAAAWLARTSTPHDIAFGSGPRPGIHHVSFYLDEWNDVLKAADILAKRRVRVEVTPQRHGITRGVTTYFFDPSGNRNEMFAGLGYLSQPDMPVITWTEEEVWRGIFYHTGAAIGDFLGVYT